MQLKVWLSFLIVSVNVSCGTMGVPATPQGKLCTIDVPRDQLICFQFGGLRMKRKATMEGVRRYIEANREAEIVPINEADKYVAFDPNSWAALSGYIEEMKAIIRKKCKL